MVRTGGRSHRPLLFVRKFHSAALGKESGTSLVPCELTASLMSIHSSVRLTTTSASFVLQNPAPGTNGPLIPGDPERESEQLRRKGGVPLILPVVEELQDISARTGILLDLDQAQTRAVPKDTF